MTKQGIPVVLEVLEVYEVPTHNMVVATVDIRVGRPIYHMIFSLPEGNGCWRMESQGDPTPDLGHPFMEHITILGLTVLDRSCQLQKGARLIQQV